MMAPEIPLETRGGFDWRLTATKYMTCAAVPIPMPTPTDVILLQLGELTSPPALLVGLALLAAVIIIGRILLAIAWRLVIIALLVVAVLWVLGVVGL